MGDLKSYVGKIRKPEQPGKLQKEDQAGGGA